MQEKLKVAVIGLGYVGLPLAVEIGKQYEVIGFDINQTRIKELEEGFDRTKEVEVDELKSSIRLSFTANPDKLLLSNFYIVTVPTPIDKYKKPDLRPILSASEMVSRYLKKGDIVVYESTVYPGCTEEDCVPILEKLSGLTYNEDFYCGYSPERINPGDKVHRLTTIKKVTSGSTPEVSKIVNEFYQSFVVAGTHLASSIKVAEAAKVIENSQRDINIAFVNELAMIFDKMNLSTIEVLEAAGSKWNFLPFRPGLVGGHCIGVDPYYLTHKAESLGYHPEVILSGRRINDAMGNRIASSCIKLMMSKKINLVDAQALVLGITFKENCPDVRNTKVIDVIQELKDYQLDVDVFDPSADKAEVKAEYGLSLIEKIDKKYSLIVLAVGHEEFKNIDIKAICYDKAVVYDVKGFLKDKDLVDQIL